MSDHNKDGELSKVKDFDTSSLGTYSDSVCRLEATNTGFCRSLPSVSCHVILDIRVVYARFQATD